MMADERHCSECGGELAADAPQGLCPQCLMKLGLPTRAEAGERGVTGGQSDVPTMTTPPAGFVAPSPAELAGQFPQLEILELLGQGGMGVVYKARQKQLDRLVALKILPPLIGQAEAFAERFTREARSLAKLNHPRIVSVHDSGHTETGLYYFIMEFVDGTDLRRVIQSGELSPAEALAIVPQVCEALQYAHEEGIVHRDVKPENILLDKKGRVKIADFGLAKLLDRPATVYTLTQAGQRMGTPHYMAPEQIEHPGQVDHRADIYSLGVVFYEMLTGQLPIGQFAPPSQKVQVDVRLDKVVLKSLAYEPERRYQHASEVKTEVETISGIPTSTAMRKFGYEYSSKTKLFGWPMLHIATGFDTVTGRKRVAKGIIAFGDVAVGVVACGGVALGGFTFGGVGIGVVAFAGVALGLLLALGGFAIGGIAFGGAAVGLIAMGGEMVGYCTYDAGKWQIGAGDTATPGPQAVAFTEFWAKSGFRLFVGIFLAIPIMVLIVWLAIWIKELVRGKTHVETISAKSKREPGMLFGIKIEDHLKIIAYIRIGIGSLFLVAAVALFSLLAIPGIASGKLKDMAILSAFGVALALLPLVSAAWDLVGGVGLLKRRRWARILVLIGAVPELFLFPVGTAIGIYTIWVLMQKETVQLLTQTSEQA